jgi:DNA-binding NarL/FixJ family response regulator
VQGFWALLNVDSKITSKSGEASSMLVDITQYSPHKKWTDRIDYPRKRIYLTDDRKGEFLTGKEFGVLQLGIHGFSTRQISTYTGRSLKTVEKRRASVADKLIEGGNRNAMWRQAAKIGLTEFLAADVDWLNMRETKAKK